MPRRTSRYALDTFLKQLARTGNFALAADLAGLAKSGLYKRKARDATFAAACEAALSPSPSLHGRSRLKGSTGAPRAGGMPAEGGGPFRAEGMVEGSNSTSVRPERSREAPNSASVRPERSRGAPNSTSVRPERSRGGPNSALKTTPGELGFSRYAGRPQRRRLPPGRLTGLGIANFFAALANCGNIRLAAAQVGVAASSIHARRRTDPDFARQVEQALALAKANIASALIQAADRTFGADWIEDVDPDDPKLTVGQMLWFVSRRAQ